MPCNEESKGSSKSQSFLIVGGDDRFVELANIFSEKGYSVFTHGMEKAAKLSAENILSLDEAVNKCGIIIGPVPFSKEPDKINAPYSAEGIETESFLRKVSDDKILFFGALNKNSRELTEKYSIKYVDYFQDEGYQILNTIPTVEGAIALMISGTDRTLFDSNVLILGYGRIGKLLSDYSKALGANVYAEARKDEDLTWIKAKGMKAVPLNNLDAYIAIMDIIVNTIPYMILDSKRLDLVKKDGFILDLASLPGGVDFAYAKQKNIKFNHALGIPGKIAAKSAAEYIFETVMKKLNSMNL